MWESFWIHSCTHHYDLDVLVFFKQIFKEDQKKICVDIPLMHLINYDMTDTCQRNTTKEIKHEKLKHF